MDLRRKFFLLSGLVGVFMAVISVIGFYTAYTNLESSVEKEFEAVVAASTNDMDGWLRSKGMAAVHTASM
ncbi:MAG: methyl-accepting chemotaxis protein, partial [Selenomonadaceae bacterium]|nr:methyl-accepting chemotaxis protein [Selenomonadaceae bacterium]